MKENRKETASNLSAHPEYTFRGIVKSQMLRLRRLCSRDKDFKSAIEGLLSRYHNSGYDQTMVNDIIKEAASLKRGNEPLLSLPLKKSRWIF